LNEDWKSDVPPGRKESALILIAVVSPPAKIRRLRDEEGNHSYKLKPS